MPISRRSFLRASTVAGAAVWGSTMPGARRWSAVASPDGGPAAPGLLDPSQQPLFSTPVPNALDPSFVLRSSNGRHTIAMQESVQFTGIVDAHGSPLSTRVWGYGPNGPGGTWPGMTLEATSGVPVEVKWQNKLPNHHLLPVDGSLHWAYSLPGYEGFSIARDGVPAVAHLHGGHTDSPYDGNPEYFFSPGYTVRGPQWSDKRYVYDNSQPAGTLWYHDHALGITRLNVYAGLAGFYILRDEHDTGRLGNAYDLPAFPYETALAIQDRMFHADGSLFYPAFPGDPFYDDFILGEGAQLPEDLFPGGGPTALAEFFGDHMLVNGAVWPSQEVEPRNYRLRLLNGCDSRFLALELHVVPAGATDLSASIDVLPMTVVGSDQGIATSTTLVDRLLVETGARYDVVVDFGAATVPAGHRVIMANVGGDDPFGGELPGPQSFDRTDRVMAFDVVVPFDAAVPDVHPGALAVAPPAPAVDRTRKVALFEGLDEFGRLQPLLGTAEPATDESGAPIQWPATPAYADVGLAGQMEGSIAWHSPTTENPALDSTEVWEVWNMTGDAHPVHLHLVHFEILDRQEIVWDSSTTDEDRVLEEPPTESDGTYLLPQPVVQHNGLLGHGFRIAGHTLGAVVPRPPEYVENAPKDMVTALPGQVTRIRATFDKPGRYVWHCHILSHEDHEMMRVLHVGPGA